MFKIWKSLKCCAGRCCPVQGSPGENTHKWCYSGSLRFLAAPVSFQECVLVKAWEPSTGDLGRITHCWWPFPSGHVTMRGPRQWHFFCLTLQLRFCSIPRSTVPRRRWEAGGLCDTWTRTVLGPCPEALPLWCLLFFSFFFFPSFLGSGLEGDKFLMFEKQLSHRRTRERKQRRPPGSSPLCGHLISSANIKALALTCNCIASCELSSLFPLPSPPTLSLLTCSASSCYPSGSFFSSFLLLKRQSAS